MCYLTTLVLLSTVTIVTKGQFCGRLGPSVTPLILNTDETLHHWPWHAAIYHKYTITSEPSYKCGGTLISYQFILTAAHCVSIDNKKLDVTNISVHLGRTNLGLSYEHSGQSFEVAEIIVHQNFTEMDYANDIAIVKLSAVAQFNNYVQPGCLWRTDISEVHGKHGTVVGWGLTEKDRISMVLRQVALPVVSWSTCLTSNPDVFGHLLSEKKYCAGSRNGTTVCLGDSGGSMTFEDENGKYYIRGIVSVSPSRPNRNTQELLCDPSQYALFTDVAQFLTWIGEKTDPTWIRDKTETCKAKVRCDFPLYNSICEIKLHHHPNQNCKIILDEPPNGAVTNLNIKGEFDVIPDLSDAVEKFENLENLALSNVKLKIVERSKLTVFGRKLSFLYLNGNEITQLDADTFDDFKKLFSLNLSNNKLTEIHVDLFEELANLQLLSLNDNQIEILPQGLFLKNEILRHIHMENNKLKKIEFQFDNMRNLRLLDLTKNVCINESCNVNPRCSSFDEINEIIRRNCTN